MLKHLSWSSVVKEYFNFLGYHVYHSKVLQKENQLRESKKFHFLEQLFPHNRTKYMYKVIYFLGYSVIIVV